MPSRRTSVRSDARSFGAPSSLSGADETMHILASVACHTLPSFCYDPPPPLPHSLPPLFFSAASLPAVPFLFPLPPPRFLLPCSAPSSSHLARLHCCLCPASAPSPALPACSAVSHSPCCLFGIFHFPPPSARSTCTTIALRTSIRTCFPRYTDALSSHILFSSPLPVRSTGITRRTPHQHCAHVSFPLRSRIYENVLAPHRQLNPCGPLASSAALDSSLPPHR